MAINVYRMWATNLHRNTFDGYLNGQFNDDALGITERFSDVLHQSAEYRLPPVEPQFNGLYFQRCRPDGDPLFCHEPDGYDLQRGRHRPFLGRYQRRFHGYHE